MVGRGRWIPWSFLLLDVLFHVLTILLTQNFNFAITSSSAFSFLQPAPPPPPPLTNHPSEEVGLG